MVAPVDTPPLLSVATMVSVRCVVLAPAVEANVSVRRTPWYVVVDLVEAAEIDRTPVAAL